MVEEVARFQPRPILVISGGDPFMRPDLFEVAAHAVSLGLRTSLSPSVTALMTPERLTRAYQAGIRHISLSLDGATAEVHDGFRGVRGSFHKTLWAVQAARQAGLTVQINTTVNRWNVGQLHTLADLVAGSGAVLWDLFFLVPTGRARREDVLSAEEHEDAYRWIHDFARSAAIRVKTTLGQPSRRVAIQSAAPDHAEAALGPTTNDGKGVCFVSHLGEVYPSGFLSVCCGNVRKDSLVQVYRTHSVFLALRDSSRLKGKCGACPFNNVCGGCRARAYAMTGDYLAADPTCLYHATSGNEAGSLRV